MDRIAQLNQFTTQVMNSYRFCKRVYEGGIESPEQFTTFKNLCQGHVDICNMLYYKLKPKFGFLQWSKLKILKLFKDTCAYTISEMQGMIGTIQSEYDKLAEIDELRETMAIKAQIEYELANEFKELDIARNKEIRESRNIGFVHVPSDEVSDIVATYKKN